MDWTIPVIILQLIFLEGILSIDNAAVLGALVTHLPSNKPIPWPHAMQKFGDAIHAILGNQRMAALRVGLLGAYVGRGAMLFMASLISRSPWLKVLGGLYLIKLAFDNLGSSELDDEDVEVRRNTDKTFWFVVINVEIADLVFSIDNVVAAVALSDKLWVVILGVFIGILFMRFAAGLFSYAVEREPILKNAAYLLVFNIGVEIFLEELGIYNVTDWQRFGISIGTLLICLAYAHLPWLHVFRPVLNWIAQGFAAFNEVITWALKPLFYLLGLVFKGLGRLFQQRPRPSLKAVDPPGEEE
jgi:tellurite resistance protein TerC